MNRLKSNFAGSFYPANPHQLATQIRQYLSVPQKAINKPLALLVPHAGVIYSGPTAGYAYKQIENTPYERVIVLGPSHQIHHTTLALPIADGVTTPLGTIDFDNDLIDQLCQSAPFKKDNSPHTQEHSLEVQFPFLQLALPNLFSLVPISVGAISADDIIKGAKKLAAALDEKTLLVISTDLSHYHSQKTAEVLDRTTINHILNFDADGLIGSYQRKAAECCGIYPILLGLAIFRELGTEIHPTLLHYDTSASTSLDDQHVVGYVSVGFS